MNNSIDLLRIMLIIAVATLSVACSSPETNSGQSMSDASLKEHLRALENRMMQAVADRDSIAMSDLIGEDFLLTSSESSGYLMPKKRYVTGSMNPDVLQVDSFQFHDFNIRFINGRNTAIVHCRIDWKSTYRGKSWNADFIMTDVWTLRDGTWKIVARHSSYPRDTYQLNNSPTGDS